MFIIIIFILFGYGKGQFPDSEYCSIPCDTGRHTMCAYPPVSRHCLHVESLMNPRRRQKILSLHNSFRNAVAGGTHPTQKTMNAPSSNMRQLYWDLELEGIAERWASQCNVSSNDDCRDVARFMVGQVMSKSGILTPSLDYYDTLFNMLWFAEVDNLSKRSLSKYTKHRNIKHVAQIINSNTMRVGCADVITKRVRGRKSIRVTICNYGPAVIPGEELYKIGHPCSNCPVGTKCRGPYSKYPHLCSEYRQFDVVEMKPNFVKIQMGYGRDDAPALPNTGRKVENARSNQGQYHSRYDEGKIMLPNGQKQGQYRSRYNEGIGNVERDDSRYKGKKEMKPEPRNPDFDDQNDDFSGEEDKFGGRFLEDDYRHNGDSFQDGQNRFGGRELDARRDVTKPTTRHTVRTTHTTARTTPHHTVQTTTHHTVQTTTHHTVQTTTHHTVGTTATTARTTATTAGTTSPNAPTPSGHDVPVMGGNETSNETILTSSSLCIHSPRWLTATLFFTVMKMTFAITRTI